MEDRQTSFGVLRLGSGSLGWDWDLEAKIWASRRGSGPPGKDLAFRLEFGPQDCDLGLETGI